MAGERTVNGIDVDALGESIASIRQEPALAEFHFRASHEWLGGGHGCTTIKDFYGVGKEDTSRRQTFELESDEPHVLLGTDLAPNATEALLHALGSCLTASFVYWAAAMNVPIDKMHVDLEGDLDVRGFLGISQDVRRGFNQIRVTFHVESQAPRDKIAQLVEAAKRYSPVFDIVTNPVDVHVRLADEAETTSQKQLNGTAAPS